MRNAGASEVLVGVGDWRASDRIGRDRDLCHPAELSIAVMGVKYRTPTDLYLILPLSLCLSSILSDCPALYPHHGTPLLISLSLKSFLEKNKKCLPIIPSLSFLYSASHSSVASVHSLFLTLSSLPPPIYTAILPEKTPFLTT